MKKNLIIQENTEIKTFIEKNKKIPLTCKFTDGTLYSIYTTSYLSSILIHNNFKDTNYNPVDVRIYDVTTYKDTINEKVLKNDYLVMIQNFISFCKEHHRVPAYITTVKSKTKVSFELFTYCLAKIIVYYKQNNTFPNYCIFNKADISYLNINVNPSKNVPSQSTSTCQNKVNLNQGCDAMGQNNNHCCGVCALQKCLYKFGMKVSQKELAKAAGTTTAGTSHQGIRTAVAYVSKTHNVKLTVKEAYFSDYTLKQLKEILCNPNKAIICHNLYRLKYGHYEAWKQINLDKKEIEVVNSLGDKCALGCYCGYIEKRSYATQKSYCNGISQKSLIIITKG